MKDREQLLLELLCSPKAAEALTRALARFGWDSDVELVTLCAVDVLREYAARDLSAAEVEAWAEALEVREDVAMEFGQDGVVHNVIHILANPAIEGPLSPERARLMGDELA